MIKALQSNNLQCFLLLENLSDFNIYNLFQAPCLSQYQGNTQTFDHILVSNNLTEHVVLDRLHINAYFPDIPGRVSGYQTSPTENIRKINRFKGGNHNNFRLISFIGNNAGKHINIWLYNILEVF